MPEKFPANTDDWLLEKAPRSEIVISSRARLARNLPDRPFALRAKKDQLSKVAQTIREALESSDYFKSFKRYDVSAITSADRKFLRESHLISADLEKGGEHRDVYLNDDARTSIMVNEEDHLRVQTMMPGLQVKKVYEHIEELERELEGVLEFAYRSQFGYLTACPTNTGTGLRVSVMGHLVALVMTSQIEDALGSLGNFGLVVRGAYGEHSGHSGDLFQISNEVTLGKTEEELVEILDQVMRQIVDREAQAREMMFKHAAAKCEDTVQRAIGVLSHARTMDSSEAVTLLSRVRLGLDRDFGLEMSHQELNRLLIEVQPAHLRRTTNTAGKSTEIGDIARADLLRGKFRDGGSAINN